VWAPNVFLTGVGTSVSASFQATTLNISIPSLIRRHVVAAVAAWRVDPVLAPNVPTTYAAFALRLFQVVFIAKLVGGPRVRRARVGTPWSATTLESSSCRFLSVTRLLTRLYARA
jgi:heme/copper-type cytochrome/quinol oxidase subunit 1